MHCYFSQTNNTALCLLMDWIRLELVSCMCYFHLALNSNYNLNLNTNNWLEFFDSLQINLFSLCRSRKLNCQLEEAIQEAMAELDKQKVDSQDKETSNSLEIRPKITDMSEDVSTFKKTAGRLRSSKKWKWKLIMQIKDQHRTQLLIYCM